MALRPVDSECANCSLSQPSKQFSRSQTSSISCSSFLAGAFDHALRRERFGPFARSLRSFTPPLLAKGQPKLDVRIRLSNALCSRSAFSDALKL